MAFKEVGVRTMQILRILNLKGPNFWSRRSCLEAWVDLGSLADSPSDQIPGLYERLSTWLPGLVEHRCGLGVRGGFLSRLKDGTYAGHILEHVTIELQNLAGTPVGFGKARETSTPGTYKVAVRYQDETVGLACLKTARELVMAAVENRPFDVAHEVARLKALAEDVILGPSTQAIVTAAQAHGIPARRLNEGSLVQLGHGKQQRRIWTAETDRTGAIAEWIAKDKELTKTVLRAAGVPIPEGRVVSCAADAWEAATEIGVPVVVKPRDGNHGRAVFTELSTQEQVEAAYTAAAGEGNGVIVEQFIRGVEHRLLVVGNQVVAAARGESATVLGDGQHTVQELIDLQLNTDPRRGCGDEYPLNPVEIDQVIRLDLKRQGLSPTAVPAAGLRVFVQRNGNVGFDVTDEVHPNVAQHVVLAAQVVGLDIAGVDVVVESIGQPLEEQRGAVVEVNSSPGLHVHLMPASGTARPVGEAILKMLYPNGASGRIPIVAVTGSSGKTRVSKWVSAMLAATGHNVGLACSDGTFVGSRCLRRQPSAEPEAARDVLLNPAIDAAVFEASAEGILRSGLGFDACDVAVVTNIAADAKLPAHFLYTPQEMFTVKRCPVDVVLPTGAAVLNAEDPLVVDMAPLCAGSVTFTARRADHPVVVEHCSRGKRAVVLHKGVIELREGTATRRLAAMSTLPQAKGGDLDAHLDQAMAAAAAAWALGIPGDKIAAVLQSYSDESQPTFGGQSC